MFKIITTLVTPPASRLLTSLYAVRQEMEATPSATANDAWCSRQVLARSLDIEKYCNRPLSAAAWQDLLIAPEDPYPYQVPGGHQVLQLSRWPMIGATPDCTVVQNFGSGNVRTLVEGTDFIVDLEKGQLTRLQVTTGLPTWWEDCPTTVNYQSGFVVQNEAWAIPDGAQLQVLAPEGPWQADRGVTYADGTALEFVAQDPAQGQYALVPATGETPPGGYAFNAADVDRNILVSYAYVPADLEDVCLRLISGRFSARNRDPLLKARDQPGGLGREEYWVGAPRMEGNLPAELARLIDHYRVPVAT